MSDSGPPQAPGSGGEPTGQGSNPPQPPGGYSGTPYPNAPAPGQSGAQYPSAPQGGFQPMPGDTSGTPGADVEAPQSIKTAVRLMYVGAALSLVSILVVIVQKKSLHAKLRQSLLNSGQTATTDKVHSLMVVTVGAVVVVSLIAVALWLWMAWANGKGKSWARIVATVLGVLDLLSVLSTIVQHQTALSVIVSVINLIIAVVILVMLWRKESSAFYAARSGKVA